MKPMTADECLVEVSDLHFSYPDRPVFSGLSLKIPRGKVVAILGASGSGKTTLLQMLGGQRRPDQGEVRVDGKVVSKLNTKELFELRKRIGNQSRVNDADVRGCFGVCPKCPRLSRRRCRVFKLVEVRQPETDSRSVNVALDVFRFECSCARVNLESLDDP